jgi:hypothetical protein
MSIRMDAHFPLDANLAHALKLVHAICCLSGSPSYVDDLHADLRERGMRSRITILRHFLTCCLRR